MNNLSMNDLYKAELAYEELFQTNYFKKAALELQTSLKSEYDTIKKEINRR